MNEQQVFDRYCELQRYVGWSERDAEQVHALLPILDPCFGELVEDFYHEIERHPAALQVITGGQAQIDRLKGTLIDWLRQLFSGQYDARYVFKRWRIGYKHVEIGLDQVYTNVALSRLRGGLFKALESRWTASPEELSQALRPLNTLLDLDLALIEDAYQTEYTFRKQATERLALIGQVAGGIAHELRNPLNVVKTSVFYLLNARNAPPEKVSQHLERIERQVGIANEVITSLTNFARLPVADQQPFNVETHLHDLISATEHPENINVIIDCPQSLPCALADASQIRIVLGNLIRNAIDAMPQGGTLGLSVQAQDPYVEISVTDTGHGMEPEQLIRAMEPFFSTKARGIGLGLPMAKAILEKNEGRIYVESEPGKGSVFKVHLRSSDHQNPASAFTSLTNA
ncbi:sensor histidine kinase [Planctomicrobium piriforme]|uniref:histidine kinase n=1 Tax=Planctomicrobium piriforme TaxID=1576369 RepID=A0A1I3B4Y1_9PLAN|nr:protoglobin domain-containing protein [Planctomicrobium piriforme]SFH57019.1 His Kinase A (phospho-acceptor) domain-containing protein [Planctomicrobium piriforme]